MLGKNSLVQNYFFDFLMKSSSVVFPLLLMPYVNRVLGPDNLGKVSLANSIVAYFILFSNVGISIYGVRAIAQARSNYQTLCSVFSELFCISIASSILITAAFMVSLCSIPLMRNESFLYLILGLNVLNNCLLLDWFFTGIEQYKYISLRNLSIKIVALILVYLLVKERSDYVIYACITTLAISVSSLFSFFYHKAYVKFRFPMNFTKTHFGSLGLFFITTLVASGYANFDIIMLGYLSNERAIAFYNTDKNIVSAISLVLLSIGTAITPRLSFYVKERMNSEYSKITEECFHYILLFALPASGLLFLLADEIILIMGGNEFIEAILSLRVLSVYVLLVSIGAFFWQLVAIPWGKEDQNLYITLSMALSSILANVFLIPKYSCLGAAVSLILAEFVGILLKFIFFREYLSFSLINRNILLYFITTVVIILPLYIFKSYFGHSLLNFLLIGGTEIIIYFGLLLISKDRWLLLLIGKINDRCKCVFGL